MAADVPALLRMLDGREVTVADRQVKLATAQSTLVRIEADWRTKLLAVITNPNVASLLMLIGVYALIFEFYSPGMIGPGVVGAICTCWRSTPRCCPSITPASLCCCSASA